MADLVLHVTGAGPPSEMVAPVIALDTLGVPQAGERRTTIVLCVRV